MHTTLIKQDLVGKQVNLAIQFRSSIRLTHCFLIKPKYDDEFVITYVHYGGNWIDAFCNNFDA